VGVVVVEMFISMGKKLIQRIFSTCSLAVVCQEVLIGVEAVDSEPILQDLEEVCRGEEVKDPAKGSSSNRNNNKEV
jgi:hypothetical protein